MKIDKKTYKDLSKKEVDIFINVYPYKTEKELEFMTNLNPEEIKKLKNEIKQERGITLTKNSNFIKKDRNPEEKNGKLTLLQKVLNNLEEQDRNDMIEFSKNMPDNITLIKQIISIQTIRLKMGINREISNPNGGLIEETEDAISNYVSMIKFKDEMENGIQMNHNIEHSFTQMIKEAKERSKNEIIIEPKKKLKTEKK